MNAAIGSMAACMHIDSAIRSMRDAAHDSTVIAIGAWGRGGLHTLYLAGLISKPQMDDGERQVTEAQNAVLALMADIRREHARAVA